MKRILSLVFFFFCSFLAPGYLAAATGTILGTVTDSVTHLPISGANVNAIKGNQIRDSDTTAADGTYSLTSQPGNYTLVFTAPGYQSQTVGAKIISNQTITVDVQLVPNGGTINGTVTNAVPAFIVGATINILQGTELIETTTTDGSGFYSVANLAPGNYIVQASAPTYQLQSIGASVQAGAITTVDFVLSLNPGTIAGTVTDTLLAPIAGALVEVFNGPVLVGFSDTNGSGNYSISDLAPGVYTVTASADGFQSTTVGASVTSGFTTTVDFVLEVPPGSIAGTVTDASTGDPIPGASINVLQGFTLVASVLTDSNGQYSISAFAPGNYLVTANANLFQQQTQAGTVISNATTTINFALNSEPGSISGQVTDVITTAPIEGAAIDVYNGQLLIATALTDPNGNYQIPNLSPGAYTVTATKTGYQTQAIGANVSAGATAIVNFALITPPGTISGTVIDAVTLNPIQGARVLVFSGQTFIGIGLTDVNGNYTVPDLAPGQYVVTASAGSIYQNAAQGATVVAGMTTTVNFALLKPPGKIGGFVTNEANGNPIAGASITVFQNFTLIASALTDANGIYSIENLAPGTYAVIANAPNFSRAAVGATVIANTATEVNFSLKADFGKIFGTVTNSATNNPIPGATVQIRNNFVVLGTEITDPDGNYFFPNLPPDTYTVTATASGFQREVKVATAISNQVTVVNFALINKPGIISGTVIDAGSLMAIPDATVAIFQGNTFIDFDITDVNGDYSIPDLEPGNYTVLAIAQGYQEASSTVTVVAGMVTVVNFELIRNPGTIAGTVTDRCTGSPLPGAIILVTDGSTVVGFGLTDSNGSYLIDTLAPGTYTVTAAISNFLIGTASATVISNETTTVNFSLTPVPLPPTTISGCVKKNVFLTQTDHIFAIFWTASPSSCVTGYQIYRNGIQIAFVSANGTLEYQDHNRNTTSDVYSVKAVNSFGQVSEAISITVNRGSKCSKRAS